MAAHAAGRTRAAYSRAYYAAYNASKAIRYHVNGVVSLKGDDHQAAPELPGDFPDLDQWSQLVAALYEHRLRGLRQLERNGEREHAGPERLHWSSPAVSGRVPAVSPQQVWSHALMSTSTKDLNLEEAALDAAAIFARAIGISEVKYRLQEAGTETFLKFVVGRAAAALRSRAQDHADDPPAREPLSRASRADLRARRGFPAFVRGRRSTDYHHPSNAAGGAKGIHWPPLACEYLFPKSGGFEGNSAGNALNSGTAGGGEVDAHSACSGTPGKGKKNLCRDGHAGILRACPNSAFP